MAFFRKKLLLMKIESVYDTDPTPTGAANAFLTRDLSITPYAGPKVQRGLDLPTLGNDNNINAAPEVAISFKVEAVGSGAATTAVAYGPMLRACAHAETVGGSDVQYDPISAAFESVTAYYNLDGQRHKITGIRGQVSLMLDKNQIPYFEFNGIGHYTTPTAVTMPVPDFSSFQKPEPVNNANTGTVTVHGHSAVLERFEFRQNGEVRNRNLPNSNVVQFVDRAPTISLSIEMPALATKNFFTAVESHAGTITESAVQVIHGSGAGKIVQFDASLVQLDDITLNESDGIAMLGLTGILIPTGSGDDEYKITTK